MEAYQITSLTKELVKLRKDKEKFDAKVLITKGYPTWIVRQHAEFLDYKPKEIEALLKESGIDIQHINIENKEKPSKIKKRTYRSKKTKK